MCVVALAWNCHPRWRLILAGNRDEFHGRPTAALQRWDDAPHLIAGRDLQSGGSWLGVSEEGQRLAVVTNLTGFGDPDPDAASRGALIADFLCGSGEHAALPISTFDRFNPFNLIVIEGTSARFLTNRPEAESQDLSFGIHALSNGARQLFWPRKDQLHQDLSAWLAAEADDPLTLFGPLRDVTGAGAEIQRPVFIDGPAYGTRCSTVIAVDRDGKGMIAERRFGPNGIVEGETRIGFDWSANNS